MPTVPDATTFLLTLWQVHAAVIALSVVIITIFVTIVSNYQGDRGRIWRIYSRRVRLREIVWINLNMLVSEGLAVLQTYSVDDPIYVVGYPSNLVLVESIFLVCSLLLIAWLFRETINFIDDDHIESVAEDRIISRMTDAIERDLHRQQLLRQPLISRSMDDDG